MPRPLSLLSARNVASSREENGYTSLMTGRLKEPDVDMEQMSKDRLYRMTNRAIRRLSTIGFFEPGGICGWLIRSSWPWFLFYALFCGMIHIGKRYGYCIRRDVFKFSDEKNANELMVMSILQLIGALLVAFTISESGARYKSAMTAVLNLQETLEQLRSDLMCNTNDPKFRLAIQAMFAWFTVLLRKKIAFFTENFHQPIADLIPRPFHSCILFDHEVLWAFDKNQFEYVFLSFLRETHMLDKEGLILEVYGRTMAAWRMVAELLMVRAPSTTNVLTQLLIFLMLAAVPMFDDDLATCCLMPAIAALFMTILKFSNELSDPWGGDFHDLPLTEILHYISYPTQFKGDEEHAESAMQWFNKGLATNDWAWQKEFPIPRTKTRGASKGSRISFEDFRSLADMSGFASYEEFKEVKGMDMKEAAGRGRRLPGYLCWRDTLKSDDG